MKNIIMPSFVLLFICCFSMYNLNAQSKTDVEDVFKMQLFLNKKNSVFRTMDYTVIKDDSLYNTFKNLITLKIDTLQIYNNLEGLLYDSNYKFYRVQDSGIIYNREFKNDDFRYLSISCWLNGFYVIAINQKTGTSYRLKGFDTNDFLNFLSDFKEIYNQNNTKKLKTKNFLKQYVVEDLNFECMYKGLRSEEIDRNKYPCLGRCSDPIRIN